MVVSHERRKSRRHSTGTSPITKVLDPQVTSQYNNIHSLVNSLSNSIKITNTSLDDDCESSSSQGSQGLNEVQLNKGYKESKGMEKF